MLDSGASCNFMSWDQFQTLNLTSELQANQSNVRLANGTVLKTIGKVLLRVQFEKFDYEGIFYILDCQVPLILGMEFLVDVQPHVDWLNKQITVNSNGCVTRIQGISVSKYIQNKPTNVALHDDNSFSDLSDLEKESSSDATDSCKTHFHNQYVSSQKKQSFKRNCKCCGHVFESESKGQQLCKKCKNNSFANLPRDQFVGKNKRRVVVGNTSLETVDGEHVSADVSADVDADVALKYTNYCEIVPLKQFIRGGKADYYLNFGLVQLFDEKVEQQLNFTHRTAHGGDGDTNSKHGTFNQLASESLQQLKYEFPTVFQEPIYPVNRSECPMVFEHQIPLIDEKADPPKRKLYPLDSVELVELKKQIKEFLESNRIEPSNGPYGAPILFAKKKDGGLRMCIDYRMLNQQTRSDAFPLPRIDELLQRLDGCVIFSKLDLRDGYHQIPMAPGDRQKTAFTCRYGTYQFTVMPFGLSTAPATFQRMMNRVFFELLDEGVLCYLDDLLIYSKSIQQHKQTLRKVFTLLAKYKLHIKESKCHLFLEQVNFLGHVVSKYGVSLEQGKVDAIDKWPEPQNVNQVQQFLGLCNYYRRFVLRFSEIASPLTLLTRKDQPFVFGDQQKQAFVILKKALCNAPTLKVFDPVLETCVVCDASNYCIGAVLEQCHDKKWHPVEYYSKRLTQAERNYSATDREFVAIKLSLERWRHFLIGKKFLLLTDHAALTYLHSTQHVSRRNARWLDFLSQFDFTIEHIKGRENIVADALSRIPGTEVLSALQLCSIECTLGLEHVDDIPPKLKKGVDTSSLFDCNAVITIHENQTFLQQLRLEQQESSNSWFLHKCNLAKHGNATWQYRDNILCKLVSGTFCPVIPTQDSNSVQIILHELHSSALGGHFGAKKVLKMAQARFFWQNMSKTVDAFVKACPVCQANKSSTQPPIGKLQPVENPSGPFQHVTMDFIMSLPASNGYDAIYTIVDRFSRYVKFIPCQSTCTASDVADMFFRHWICVHGMPQKIISDRDVRFQSHFWQQLMKQLDCRVALSSAYHPQTDGLSERFHRTLEQVLRCYCSSNQELWSNYLDQCTFAINSTVQDAIGMSPFKCIYGFDPIVPLDRQLSPLQAPSVVDYVSSRLTLQKQVAASLRESQERMKKGTDHSRRHAEFEVGQKVWLSTAHLPLREGTRKLAARWAGPFPIRAIIAPTAIALELPEHWRIHSTFHSSQLKAAVGSPPRPEPLAVASSPEQEYEVQAILDKRITRNRTFYLVRWKGYDAFEDTWEPQENLRNCSQLVEQFESTLR